MEALMIALYALLCVVQASVFLYCMYRSLSLGRAYEQRLREKYPDVAQKRRANPLFGVTFPGMPIPWHRTGEAEIEDPMLNRMRNAIFGYFIGACLTVCLPAIAVLIATGAWFQ